MCAYQVRVVHISIKNILTGLHLSLQLFDHVALLNKVVIDANTRHLKKGLGQGLTFVLMGG